MELDQDGATESGKESGKESGEEFGEGQPLLDRVARRLHDLGRVHVGFSGGLDSTVLLHLAARLARARGMAPPVAVHVHHGLQASADAWLAHADDMARRFGVTFLARRVTVARAGSVEAAARAARYAVFRELLAEPGSCLLLAHHRDDQVETILMRALQGRGAYGMPERRRLAAGVLLRPLLDVPRLTLLQYAREQDLTWVEDASNAASDADRNFLRNDVLPRLRARFLHTDQALLGLARTREWTPAPGLSDPSAGDSLALAALESVANLARVSRVRDWLGELGVASPPTRALQVFVEQLTASADRQPALSLSGGELRRFRDRIWFVPEQPALAPSYLVPADGRLELPHGVLLVQPDPDGVAASPPFTVRFRKGGEHIDFNGHRRELKTLLHEAGIPPWVRDGLPLLHDAAGLFCVPGIVVRDAATGVQAGDRVAVRWYPREPAPHIR